MNAETLYEEAASHRCWVRQMIDEVLTEES